MNSTDNEQIIKGVNSSLNLEKADPTNLNNKQKSKTSKKIVIVKKGRIASNTIPEDTEIYIDGTKSSKTELDNISPDLIDSIDITRSATNEKMLKVTTKKKQ
ncbi:hypothetical protein RCH18_003064 [Flavobacterium sp. PL11]|uniref:hypothetical protein n=1 Tax=Flavobacterium sp. PL11 TaxID=3071717 RepID=UPI002DFD3490|nr:hypothetical protein [Flavobacterium sp. PL11]